MKKILLIEDDETISKALDFALGEEGYEVLCAEDGESGLEKARSEKPDIILLDIMLPKMNGFEVCQALKTDAKFKSIPIVMMTGLGDTENTVKGLTLGADDYVSKPFNFKELLARLQSHLRMKELYDTVKTGEEEKTALLDVSQSLASTMNPHDTLYTIVSKIAEVIEVKRCSIIYVDPSSKQAYVMASHDSKEVKHLKVDIEKYPEIQRVVETGKSVVINDVYTDPILFSVREILSLIDVKSIMAFPVSFKDTLIGTLILRTARREAPFNEREIRFCEVISHLAAAPLKNAYLFEILHMEKEKELEKRLAAEEESKVTGEMLEIICQIQSEFILGAESTPTFERLLGNLLAITQSEYGLIAEMKLDSLGKPYLVNHISSRNGADEKTVRFFKENPCMGFKFGNLENLLGAVIKSGEPVISNQPGADSRRGRALPDGHPAINSFLGLPLCKGKEIIGMVAVANRPGGYEEGLIGYLAPFLATCANIMVSTQNEIQRKQAEGELKEKTDRLEKFHKLTVGREMDMVRLKQEVNALLKELGKPEKYGEAERIK